MERRRLTTREAVFAGIDLWNELHPTLAIDRQLANQYLYAPPPGVAVRAWGGYSDGDLVGFVVAKHLTEPIPGYEDGNQGWLSLLAVDGTCEDAAAVRRDLVDAAVDSIRDRGIDAVSVGKDVQKFLAGVPEPLVDHYDDPLSDAGFSRGRTIADLYRDVSTPAAAEAIAPYLETDDDVRIDRVRTAAEADALREFVEREFPGRWAYQVRTLCRLPGGTRDYWLVWVDDEPVAFARTGTADSPASSSCVNWRAVFGDRYCGLGPIGVGEDARGNAWGLKLIAAVADAFGADGYHHMTIDGVAPPLLDYYDRLGFEPWTEFVEYSTDA